MNTVVMTVTLVTQDGVPIDAVHLPSPEAAARAGSAGRPADGTSRSSSRTGSPCRGSARWSGSSCERFNRHAGVVTFDFRGHGRSGGLSTLGDKEIDDLDVAVRYARELGYQRVATVGFSMGGSVVLRHAALRGGVDAVVSVSGPGRWYYRGTRRCAGCTWRRKGASAGRSPGTC